MPSVLPASGQSPASSVEYNDEIARGDSSSSNNNPNCGYTAQSTDSSSFDRLNSNSTSATPISSGFVPATTALEQYRLQLYNYALHMERLRYAPQGHSQHQSQQQQRQQSYNSIGSSNVYSATAYVPGNRLALSMSLFPQHIFKPEDPKPQHSYIGLIAMAILSSAELKLVLSDIYQYILDNYPYFRTRGPGWRNSIRHNLSLNDCFVKSGRSANGKGHYWAIHPANMEDFRKGDFRRRKAQRKVRKHMGLSVDDGGTDSPSPPPLDLSSPPPHTINSSLHTSHSTHPFTVAQQLAAFGYIQQQRQQPPVSIMPQLAGQQCNFRPLAARYYITASPNNSVPYGGVHQRLNDIGGNSRKSSTATASVFANIYSQSRKRQFDVASLLAPDDEVSLTDDHDSEMQETTTTTTTTTTLEEEIAGNKTTQVQQTVITKLTLNHQCHHNNILQQPQITSMGLSDTSAIEEHSEDIDVVDIDARSDAPSIEEESQHIDDWFSNNRNENQTVNANKKARENIDLKDIECETSHFPENNANFQNSSIKEDILPHEYLELSKSIDGAENKLDHSTHCPIASGSTQVRTAAEEHCLTNNNGHDCNDAHQSDSRMDPYVLGRYYGTYMAAAARRLHVGTTFNQ